MKAAIVVLILFPFIASAQTQFNNFELKNGKLLYRGIFKSDHSVDELSSIIRKSLKIDVNAQSENLITGYISKIDVNVYAKKYGFDWSSIPSYIANHNVSGIVNIELKEGKYRITISDIYIQKKYSTSNKVRSNNAGDIQQLEEVVLNFNKDRVQNHFLNNGSLIYNRTFNEVFDFNNSEVILDNNF